MRSSTRYRSSGKFRGLRGTAIATGLFLLLAACSSGQNDQDVESSPELSASSETSEPAAPQTDDDNDAIDLKPASVQDLRVIIGNDDGVQDEAASIGLFELRKALCAAGADVVVAAPWLNQSGASASITYGSEDSRFVLGTPEVIDEYIDDCADAPSGGPLWGACVLPADSSESCRPDSETLTPVDAITMGASTPIADLLGWDGGPDVILSGINSGGNDGANTNISGTLGAATVASSLGFPTVALSASTGGDAQKTYRAAAEWSTDFIGTLVSNDLLPEGYVLSANYPQADEELPTDAEWSTVAQKSPYGTGFVQHPDEDELFFESTYEECQDGPFCGNPSAGSDSALYSSGKIAITPVSVDRTVGSTVDFEDVKQLVDAGTFSAQE